MGASLLAVAKSIYYYIGGGVAVLVMNNSKLIKSQANSKFTSPPPPPTFHVTIDPLSTVFFIFQAGRVLMYMVLF